MRDRIEISPQVHFGKPCVAGTRIPVHDVLELVGEGIPFDQIVHDYYPDLEIADIQACVRFAANLLARPDAPRQPLMMSG